MKTGVDVGEAAAGAGQPAARRPPPVAGCRRRELASATSASRHARSAAKRDEQACRPRATAHASPRRSSSRSASSEAIASSFISSSTACVAELRPLEQVRELEDEPQAAGCRSRQLRRHALEELERRLERMARQAVGGERPLHAGVRGDHGPARVRLGAQVVERVVEERGQLVGQRLVGGLVLVAAATRRCARMYAAATMPTAPTASRRSPEEVGRAVVLLALPARGPAPDCAAPGGAALAQCVRIVAHALSTRSRRRGRGTRGRRTRAGGSPCGPAGPSSRFAASSSRSTTPKPQIATRIDIVKR